MSDRFHPISMEDLSAWVFGELEAEGAIFGIPRELFFTPAASDRFRTEAYGHSLETPFGPAAGPHTQMAQNIVVAWLCGARFIELKTVQTLDRLDVNKPCIDMEDEGYNVEWSQELRMFQSFDEYLRAWVLIHALHRRLGFPGERPGVVFNMSVGYDLAGILRPNVQWYLDTMRDASAYLGGYVEIVARHFPGVREVEIPGELSDNVTLSTMHGCPPGEIERIAAYLLEERGLHTAVKCNPTLLGAERVRPILHGDLGYGDVVVPDAAFGHDLRWEDAAPMFGRLQAKAGKLGRHFGLKLSNTLEVENFRTVFPEDSMMYLSGRPLHALTTNLALLLAEEFAGAVPLSFAGGADCFNAPHLLAGGLRPVTVCSDLLKTGGYLRLRQYLEVTAAAMETAGATDLDDFARRTAGAADTAEARLANLRAYAAAVRTERRYRKDAFETARSKTARPLGLFDCIEAPCTDECAVDQDVPQYMAAVREGRYADAVAITRRENPLASILGHVCDHRCEHTCIRTHLDEPLAIRHLKRFIMVHEGEVPAGERAPGVGRRVAIIGAGPAGLSAARLLAEAGIEVTIFEKHPYSGGMVGGAIPAYRLPRERIDQDVAGLADLGVRIEYGREAGKDFSLSGLRARGFGTFLVAVGAQVAKRLGIPGEDAEGVLDGIALLRSVREGRPRSIGRRVAVVGAGDTAMDCARTSRRLGAEVAIVYRRTIDQMPADREEVRAMLEEGVAVQELTLPVRLLVEDGHLAGLVCTRMEYRGDRDPSGRKVPHPVEGSEVVLLFDTLLLAVSQHALLDFFDGEYPELTGSGYLACDPETLETSLPGVYVAGDASAHGPASIVQAAGDGKRAAAAIIGRALPSPAPHRPPDDRPALIGRRARREWRVPVRRAPLVLSEGFAEDTLGYTPAEARAEASRCLDCDRFCSICVGVCPNLAILTYASEPLAVDLPGLTVRGDRVEPGPATPFRVDQRLQVAVLTDFCNECGNCATFCPTAGKPFRDKPRLYLDRADFEAQEDNAFLLVEAPAGRAIEARAAGETHRVEVDGVGVITYRAPRLSVRLDPATWEVLEGRPEPGAAEGEEVSLALCAAAYGLLTGLDALASYLPTAGAAGSRVGHPGYEE
ncbi:MAG TPA: putative selenate reductase subunit YgfK [Acidimicrobiia bacterium]|nr:putative selenate reductase subunit YgfK [Acidimicrobiia bacterium]